MLSELHIKNFALIEDQQISFSSGLNVISGETGSGKSIVLQALELILGARPKAKYVRKGTEAWEVEALFDLSRVTAEIRAGLPEIVGKSDELVLSRSQSDSGRNRVMINGNLATVAMLEEISKGLINVCGQGFYNRLLDSEYHLSLLDSFAGLGDDLGLYRRIFQDWKAAEDRYLKAKQAQDRSVVRKAELEFIVEELGKVNLTASLRSDLEAETKRLGGAESLIARSQEVVELINADTGINANIRAISGLIIDICKIDEGFESERQRFEGLKAEFFEFSRDLEHYADHIEVDQESLSAKRNLLAEVARLERKYRLDCAGLVNLFQKSTIELNNLGNTENLESLQQQAAHLHDQVLACARLLSKKRRGIAEKFCRSVETELKELNMNGTRLEAQFQEVQAGKDGCDAVELLIMTNKGEEAKPLRLVASGGELSRLMLVMKKILKDQSGVHVLVFDEVDTGVSGKVARAMGEKLKSLSQGSQVLAISHLPQVASLADRHLLVRKEVSDRAYTRVELLSSEQRVEEIARMLAGYEITASARESARELLSS